MAAIDNQERAEGQVPGDILHSVFQLGIIVSDLDAKIAGMRQAFGIEPDLVQDCHYPDLYYHGEEIHSWAHIAKYEHFGVKFEFIQPLGDDSMWSDALKASPNGAVLHHIRFNDVPNNDEFTQLMASRGISLLQEGGSVVNPGSKFSFYDTENLLGFVTEVVTASPDSK